MNNTPLVFNGVNAVTGEYLFPALLPADIARVAMGERIDPAHLSELKHRHERSVYKTLGPIEGIDASDLAQTGWGVIFASGADPALRTALRPLLEADVRRYFALKPKIIAVGQTIQVAV